jgi:hypothetical protein
MYQTDPLPAPGPQFQPGETVAFFPAVVGPVSAWLKWPDAVIDEVNEAAGTFTFHFVDEISERHGQDLENIVRLTATYRAWRSGWEQAFAESQDESAADEAVRPLWLRVLAEHPIHGAPASRHPALPPVTLDTG